MLFNIRLLLYNAEGHGNSGGGKEKEWKVNWLVDLAPSRDFDLGDRQTELAAGHEMPLLVICRLGTQFPESLAIRRYPILEKCTLRTTKVAIKHHISRKHTLRTSKVAMRTLHDEKERWINLGSEVRAIQQLSDANNVQGLQGQFPWRTNFLAK